MTAPAPRAQSTPPTTPAATRRGAVAPPPPQERHRSSSDQQPPRAGRRQWLALAVLVLPVLLISVDATVLSFALPAISASLEPTGSQLLWIVDTYSLVLAGLLVTCGNLGDRFGRRRLLLVGAAGFGLSSIAAAYAQSPEQLIAARALLGLFGATLMPSTLSLLRTIFVDREQRRFAFAVWAGGFAGGAALGPLVGGWLLERYWWGAVMLLGVPVMVLLVVVGPWLLPESRSRERSPLDLPSVGLSMVAMVSLVYGVKVAAEGSWGLGAGAVVLGLAVGTAFVRRQRVLTHPLLDLALFAIPVFRAAVLANLMSILAMFGLLYCLAQYLQLVLGLSPVTAGLLLVPGLVLGTAAGFAGAALARRVRLQRLIVGGLALSVGGYLLASQLGSAAGPVQVVLAFAVLQTGVGLAETLTNDAILSASPADRAGAASAISETGYEVGAVLGTALLGSVLNAVYRMRIAVPDGVGAEDAAHASETLGGATAVAADLPAATGEALLTSARDAFTHGLDVTAVVGAVVVAGAAVVVHRQLRVRG